jgi:UDP-4-amino-4,6-dideoxy-N-acetyl-beta-L-altrosamine transaminase
VVDEGGATRTPPLITYGKQSLDADDIAAVVEVLQGDWLTQGPHVEGFEDALRSVTGARHAVAFANGTAALHAAVAAADIGAGATVATSALTFAASAACALYNGATPVFVDIDADSLNLDIARVPTCDALVAVHYAGLPVDLSSLGTRPAVVIEDASHALGARTPDGPVGNCARSDMCTFSFHPVKTITTGEGGAVTTNSDDLADRLRRFRNHGMRRRPDVAPWFYEIDSLGFNYRLTDIQAALGTSQLRKLDAFVDRRTALADRYRRALSDAPVTLPPGAPGSGWTHAYHLFPVRIDRRDEVFEALRVQGIASQVHYVPVYRHPLYARYAEAPEAFPNTEHAYARLLSLPLHPRLSDDDQDRVVQAVRDAVHSP